jgi:hypothetical protein
MEITLTRILPYLEDPEMNRFEAVVYFFDDSHEYHENVEVNVFLDKNENLSLAEIRKLAIQRAFDILSEIVKNRPS